MRRGAGWWVVGFVWLGLAGTLAVAAEPEVKPAFDPKVFKALSFRNIGPFRGGRVTAVTGIPGDRQTYYMGSTGGGVWKTTDAGLTWRSVADASFKSASVGAIAVAPSDRNVIYAGMGSACVRGNTSPGDGVYRSTDAGETWTRAGLQNAGQIGRIAVHPTDPDLVYVAVLGHAFGLSEERGVFRSRDGGKSWQRVLFVSEQAGAVDLAMDPANPRVLYAATWVAERKPWTFISGGKGSGLHKSVDGGETWTELTEGLPKGTKGRIGVSVSGAEPRRVWALVEAEDGGLFRSDDAGKTFRLINPDRNFRQRAWYYTHVYADPKDINTVYILNVNMWRSDDAGKNFQLIRAPHGDNHDLWIAPEDPQRMINGNDGGATITSNGGRTWSSIDNQPTSEIYRVITDNRFPYYVYGCQQDNSCLAIPSRVQGGGIEQEDWYVIGGCESGHVAVDPRNPMITYSGCYGGSIGRFDHATDQERDIMAWPQLAVGQAPKDLKYRFQWNAPILLSPHDPAVLYHTSQFVHRSTNEGQSWTVISPDLTRNDPKKQDASGGPITLDNTGAEVYGTVFALAESPRERGVLWAGSDDGLVHLSRDNGRTWTNVTPKRMPEWGQVNSIEVSPHATGRVFLAVTRYKTDDFRPYIFRTDDHGRTWDLLTDGSNGIPATHFTRVVREDPDRRGLLFAGTEFGLYVSFDDGRKWQSFQQGLPITPVTDLTITRKDVVVATQGRSFWILDDLTALHEMTDAVAGSKAHLFTPRETVRYGGGGSAPAGAGANPPAGVMIHYLLAEAPAEGSELKIEVLDQAGTVLRSWSSLKEEPAAPNPFARFLPPGTIPPRKLPVEASLNRFVWDLRLADAEMVDDAVLWGTGNGPRVAPGRFKVRLSLGSNTLTRDVAVAKSPLTSATQEDLDAQFRLSRQLWEDLSASHRAMKRIRDIRAQVNDLTRRLTDAGMGEGLDAAAKDVRDPLEKIETRLHQTRNEAVQDPLNYQPQLDNRIIALMGIVDSGDARPTDGAVEMQRELHAELESLLSELRAVEQGPLARFSDRVRTTGTSPVILPAR
ncbi:MAG: WD40/YVTN/BNR-like repeat-containing protein [Candidatus Polarisedimenticolia bacterium]